MSRQNIDNFLSEPATLALLLLGGLALLRRRREA
ncbi:MAG: PEP-CTERM sorting domain-containing protein [Phycisphaerae bacterium]|nr:PEP-CTERM sorting domain-containing protein [Phycisphaerae bacterium]